MYIFHIHIYTTRVQNNYIAFYLQIIQDKLHHLPEADMYKSPTQSTGPCHACPACHGSSDELDAALRSYYSGGM